MSIIAKIYVARICNIYTLIYSSKIDLKYGLQEIKIVGEIKYSYINPAKILFGLLILENDSS